VTVRPTRLVSVVAASAAALTVIVVAVPFVRFAYRAPALHVALETVNAVVALLVAYLVYGRYRESHRLQELLLTLALSVVAVANLVLTAVPAALAISEQTELSRWAPLAVRLLGTLLFTTAALVSPAVLTRPGTARRPGQGFDPAARKTGSGGFGLTSMRERAEGLGA
jgi:ABC-type phosphate/phosphonate transport system permease subunit